MNPPEGSSCSSVPLEHLDYSFIQSCSDLKHLEQILRVLRSGQEGVYPDLVQFCETHIQKLFPKSRVLRKENLASTAGCFSSEEWRNICDDLQMWERNIRAEEEELQRSRMFSDAVPPVPPLRSSNGPLQRSVSAVKNTSNCPRPYRDWDRFDVEAECSKIDEIPTSVPSERPTVKQTVSNTALTAQETHNLARRETHKGNDAFRSGDYEEALAYYSRSLSLASSVAALNNRAQTHIRLERWSNALTDCDAVLQLQPTNTTALLRRATAHRQMGLLQKSSDDLRAVLLLEPNNTTAQKLLAGVTEQHQERRSTGRKILVQEVDDEEEEEAQDDSRREERDDRGIMGHTHNMKTDMSSADSTAVAPPTGHTHTPLHNTQHTHTPAIPEDTAAEFQLLKDEADGLFRSGCYQDAVDQYTHCLLLRPHQCAVYTNRALCFLRLQRFTEARQDCDSALQLQPTNKKAFYRRALANQGLKDYPACRSDLQQVLRLDASVTEAEQLLLEIKPLLTNTHTHTPAARRTVHITEVDDEGDDDDEVDDEGDDEGRGSAAGVRSIVPQVCGVFAFGQALHAALRRDDLLSGADLLRCVSPDLLPRLLDSQLDAHTLSFILRALDTHLLHTHPELVLRLLQQLRDTHRFTMVLMMLGRDDRIRVSRLFQTLHAVQSESFSPNDVSNLANKYILPS